MSLTITTDLTDIVTGGGGTWTDISGGGASISETDYFVSNTTCRSRAVSGAGGSRGMVADIGLGNELDFTIAGANEDELIYIWIGTFAPGLVDNVATAPGFRIRLVSSVGGAGDDWREWDVLYSDLLASEGPEFFRLFVLDPRAPGTRDGPGTFNPASVRHFGVVMDTNATSKGNNMACDQISHGRGELIVTGTTSDVSSGFQEMVDAEWNTVTARQGIIEARGEANFVHGKLVIGDGAGALLTEFFGQDTQFVWEDSLYYDGTRIRPMIGYDDNGVWTGRDSNGLSYYGIDIRGNGTLDTDATFGAKVGTGDTAVGRSGPSFTGAPFTPTELLADDAAVEDVLVYGSRFVAFRLLDFSANAASDEVIGNTFVECGSLDSGPVQYRNNQFINGLGAGYEFLERFNNVEAAAEALATADPTILWEDVLNGSNLSIPANAGYVEVLDPGASDRREVTVVANGDVLMASDDHYAEAIVRFPSGGANQSELGPVIRCSTTVSTEDYYYIQVDLLNDTISLIECSAGSDTVIDGPDAFTMDEDEDYLVHLRAEGTTIEAHVSGNSVADGAHTAKLSATDATHSGANNRRIGIRADAEADQTGDAPQLRQFGAGPVTDIFGALAWPATDALKDAQANQFINCARAALVDATGTFADDDALYQGNLVGLQNDSGGAVTVTISGGDSPVPVENIGAASTTISPSVTVTITCKDNDGVVVEGIRVRVEQESDGSLIDDGETNVSGVFTFAFTDTTPVDTIVRARLKRFRPNKAFETIESGTGMSIPFAMQDNPIVNLP